MFNLNLIKEFKSAGLVSKKLVERVILATDNGQAPAAINPALPQSDANISGHSTADKPLADQTPAAEPAAPAAPMKSQKDYLVAACTSALSTAEACMESLCEGKCFEGVTVDPNQMTEMTEMYGKLKEFKGKMEAWAKGAPEVPNAPAVPAPAAATPPAPAEAAPAPAPAAPAPAPTAAPAAPMTSQVV